MPPPLRRKSLCANFGRLGRVDDRRHNRVEGLMSQIRISTMVLLGVVQKIRKSIGSYSGLFLSLCWQAASATIRSAALMLAVALLAVSPLPVSAATPDPV